MSSHTPAAAAPVVVIDLQTGMFDGAAIPPIHDADGLVARVREVTAWGRRTGRKVAFVRHDSAPGEALAPGKPGWPVWPALGQGADEPTFGKSVGDSFSNPDFARWVAEQGAGEVVLMGAQTDQCVAATVKGALAAGLAVTVVSDAHSTWAHGGETAPQIVARYNGDFAAEGVTVVTAQALVGA
jgi:nicotinamidase-related amidase